MLLSAGQRWNPYPDSLIESAYIDGANDYTVLFKIITPLIKPTLAVLALYYGVGHWNSWFNASLYITDNELLPIQNILRAILIANNDMLNQGLQAWTASIPMQKQSNMPSL